MTLLRDIIKEKEGIKSTTAALNQFLASASNCGPVHITVDRTHQLGGIKLVSNLTLELLEGSELIASGDYSDFVHCKHTIAESSTGAFLYGLDLVNVRITGTGKINGNAMSFFSDTPDAVGYKLPNQYRPRIIVLEGCENVNLSGVSVVNSPMWTIHLAGCKNAQLSGLHVDNDLDLANTDSLDIDSCSNVSITNCYLSSADDALCFKTTKKLVPQNQQALANVAVSNCKLRSKSCAIKIGTETFYNVRDMAISNCQVFDSNRGIGVFSRDGGDISNISITNCKLESYTAPEFFWGKADPVFVSARARTPGGLVGKITQVVMSGLQITTHGAINMHSVKVGLVSNVALTNSTITQVDDNGKLDPWFDTRPPCNPYNPGASSGLDNAYKIDPDTNRPFYVDPYPGYKLPAVFTANVPNMMVNGVEINRPDPLPSVYSTNAIVHT